MWGYTPLVKGKSVSLKNYISESEFVEHYLKKNNDPRSIRAKQFYRSVPFGHIRLLKTPRAGATTSLCSEYKKLNIKEVKKIE